MKFSIPGYNLRYPYPVCKKYRYVIQKCVLYREFDSILNLSVMLGNYLQQTTSADNIFRYIFSWLFKG